MKVLYDYQAFTMQYFGGISKCLCELIEHLPYEIKTEISICQSKNIHLQESGLVRNLGNVQLDEKMFLKCFPFHGMGHIYKLLTKLGWIHGAEGVNQKCSIEALKKQQFDVFHPTFYNPYFLSYIGSKPWVITIHDMMPELFPQYFNQDDMQIVFKRKYLNKASAIIAVSENTKKDIVNILGIPENKITVIYHGGPIVETIKDPPIFHKPYFLYVGNRIGYKNFHQTLVDFSFFHSDYKNVLLVCTGNDFNQSEREMIAQLALANNVIYYKADDKQMKNLYTNAIAFVYPSLYEGFGMPILEAFAYGCPVLLNQKSCFPEIAGNAGIYFDSIEGHSNLPKYLGYIYNIDNMERSKIVNNGYKRLKNFSWKKSAKQLARVYINAINESYSL